MSKTPEIPETFKNMAEVLRWLQADGYKIEKSKFYQDKKDGVIRADKGKLIPDAEVLAYIVRAGIHKSEEYKSDPAAVEEAANEKRGLEIENLKLKNRKEEFLFEKEMGKWMLKADADVRQVLLLTVIDTNFRQFIDTVMFDICNIVGGSVKNLNDAKDHAETEWDEMLNKLARTDSFSFEVEEDA